MLFGSAEAVEQALRSGAPERRDDVAVRVQGEADLAVAERFHHHARVFALRDKERRTGVPQIVESDGFGERLANHWHNRAQVFARSQFGDHSSIRLMSRDLGCDNVGDQLLPRTHHGGRGFIAGAFDAEDVSVGHISILAISD